ncbi:glycerate 2-kinase [Desulfacinum hydrothermale DSM 13146]|uniref:Glycerate 2-kinase n=1 Tax=Desulfacinum hydrothermale DSM 13146 TaxID=1121390 RepID=A0A1W1XV13_9BACT|nr:glycerate kinase [Desulfacinum hydrothermale]SMC27799.1 glycerate 2-kinase [Desulfacinum hydrothermale DSM 13146]
MEGNPRTDLEAIFRAGLAAVDPEAAVRRHVTCEGSQLGLGNRTVDLNTIRHVFVVGAGKGTAPMAKALEDLLGDRIQEGAITVKYGHGLPLGKVQVMEAAHPVPDEAGVEATETLLKVVQKAGEEDLVLTAFSGGGSALTPAPVTPLTLGEKQETTRLLLACGATIQEINAIRKHLSRIKGGGLARAAHPARTFSLILSDVIGDPLDVIASGPTAPDPSTFQDCLDILDRYGLVHQAPPRVVSVLREGRDGRRPETPKPGDAVFQRVENLIVGSNLTALLAARQEAERRGYRCLVLTSRLEGEAREAAKAIAAIAKECAATGTPVGPPACLLFGGETTVTLRGDGKGGRNQEVALACALALEGWEGIFVLSAGTDGTDGPTDAAGAFADGTTAAEARRMGLSPHLFLDRNDAYRFFQKTGGLLITGPTRTNVMDLICVVIR